MVIVRAFEDILRMSARTYVIPALCLGTPVPRQEEECLSACLVGVETVSSWWVTQLITVLVFNLGTEQASLTKQLLHL